MQLKRPRLSSASPPLPSTLPAESVSLGGVAPSDSQNSSQKTSDHFPQIDGVGSISDMGGSPCPHLSSVESVTNRDWGTSPPLNCAEARPDHTHSSGTSSNRSHRKKKKRKKEEDTYHNSSSPAVSPDYTRSVVLTFPYQIFLYRYFFSLSFTSFFFVFLVPVFLPSFISLTSLFCQHFFFRPYSFSFTRILLPVFFFFRPYSFSFTCILFLSPVFFCPYYFSFARISCLFLLPVFLIFIFRPYFLSFSFGRISFLFLSPVFLFSFFRLSLFSASIFFLVIFFLLPVFLFLRSCTISTFVCCLVLLIVCCL